MKGSTVVIVILGIGVLGGGAYLLLRRGTPQVTPQTPQVTPQTPQVTSTPWYSAPSPSSYGYGSGYQPGGDQTANNVSQWVSTGTQVLNFGKTAVDLFKDFKS